MYGYKRNDRFGRSRSFSENIQPIRVSNEPIENFRKNFYSSSETMTAEEAEKLRNEHEMKITGNEIPLPTKGFNSLGFAEDVVKFFTETKKFENPTPIQSQGWPMALSGRDMVGVAATGSGKTISFLLPALIHARDQPPLREGDGPIVLILAPTRELATQIETVCYELTGLPSFAGMKSLCVYGGAGIVPQKKALNKGVEVLVATPGRLIDLHEQGFCPLNRVTFLVLDEADRMLDMGFEPQLNKIIPQTNKNRQTLMWSATWPKEVRNLAYNYASKDQIQVTIGGDELKVNKKIVQKVEVVSAHDKEKKLQFLLADRRAERVIIFCNKKSTCNKLEYMLRSKRFSATAIHGDKSQAARDSILDSFRKGRDLILIATDVAARGLDIKDVKLVINYDLPNNLEDYVHRVGRTARGTNEVGNAFTMFSPEEDSGQSKKFIELLKSNGDVEIPQELLQIAERSRPTSFNRRYAGGRNMGQRSNSFYSSRKSDYSGDYNRRNYY
ncbi:hypothetical protein NUSPORA_01734 [Nucleospora cyclopteri]